MPVVVLSDGEACTVRQLGIFELDGKARELVGPYRYSVLLASGVIKEDEYVMPVDAADIPLKPEKPQAEYTPEDWTALREFETYEAAIAHEKLRIESYEGYVNDITAYILNNCLSEADKNRLQAADWPLVYRAALVPALTEEGLADTLRHTFQGFLWEFGNIGRLNDVSRRQGQRLGLATMGT